MSTKYCAACRRLPGRQPYWTAYTITEKGKAVLAQLRAQKQERR